MFALNRQNPKIPFGRLLKNLPVENGALKLRLKQKISKNFLWSWPAET